MFDWKKPTVQMLGRWQPWHDGHQALFKRCVAKTGQVVIQVRDVQGASGGDGQDDNPFNWDEVCKNIEEGLLKDGFKLPSVIIVPPANPKNSCMPMNVVVKKNSLVANSSVKLQDSPRESIGPFSSNIINKGNKPRRPYK